MFFCIHLFCWYIILSSYSSSYASTWISTYGSSYPSSYSSLKRVPHLLILSGNSWIRSITCNERCFGSFQCFILSHVHSHLWNVFTWWPQSWIIIKLKMCYSSSSLSSCSKWGLVSPKLVKIEWDSCTRMSLISRQSQWMRDQTQSSLRASMFQGGQCRDSFFFFYKQYVAHGRESEKTFNPDITEVKVIVSGIPNKFYSQGMETRDMWEEALRRFGRE